MLISKKTAAGRSVETRIVKTQSIKGEKEGMSSCVLDA